MGLEDKTKVKIPKLKVGEVIEREIIEKIIETKDGDKLIITKKGQGRIMNDLLNRPERKEKEYNLYLLFQTSPGEYDITPIIIGGKKYFEKNDKE
ncbi:MAG: hypothetical protein P8X70_00775 [Nanoarchaeota archaeon]